MTDISTQFIFVGMSMPIKAYLNVELLSLTLMTAEPLITVYRSLVWQLYGSFRHNGVQPAQISLSAGCSPCDQLLPKEKPIPLSYLQASGVELH